MAYFGDTIAHASLLGVAVSLLLDGALPMTLSVFLVATTVAVILARKAKDARLHADTWLGVLSHGALALGLVLVALNTKVQVDVNSYLFGDVLAMGWEDVGLLLALALLVIILLAMHWRGLADGHHRPRHGTGRRGERWRACSWC